VAERAYYDCEVNFIAQFDGVRKADGRTFISSYMRTTPASLVAAAVDSQNSVYRFHI